jgi:hypothetical protein
MRLGEQLTRRHPVGWPIIWGLFLSGFLFVMSTWVFHFPHQIGGRVFMSVVIGGALGFATYYAGRRLRGL